MQLSLDDIGLTSLTKANLCAMLFDQLGVNKREAADIVDSFFEIISGRLVAGEDVRLADFATFAVKEKSSRPGRNPKTGACVQIPPRSVVTFQPGPKLKSKVNGKSLNT
jgi:integration host factor subunit alpha